MINVVYRDVKPVKLCPLNNLLIYNYLTLRFASTDNAKYHHNNDCIFGFISLPPPTTSPSLQVSSTCTLLPMND